jgi:5-amino-6-(5-phosphoribosylamino)uracil reductase
VDRPYVVLSCAMSLDGYIDDRSGEPLRLSSDEDMDRVDELRAGCDAILVGAGTIRADNPVLLLRSEARRDARAARGEVPHPVRVVISASGDLDPAARIFTTGADRVVYVPAAAAAAVRNRLGGAAEVVAAGDQAALGTVLADLAARGVARLLVEGGTSLHTQFLAGGLADELVLAVAPFFIGDAAAPRFVHPGPFPWNPGNRARLTEVTRAGDMAVLRYALSSRAEAGRAEAGRAEAGRSGAGRSGAGRSGAGRTGAGRSGAGRTGAGGTGGQSPAA